jgi:DNA-binding LacI/PurR family transcriptional regulator
VEQVALAAGVSRQTVSNVLNSPGIVREATRRRVELAIEDLGYRPHAAARRLRTQRSSTIGIHLDPYAGGISGVLLDRFVHALTDRAGERGMRILAYAARTVDDEIAQMRELFEAGEVDAIVVTGTTHDDRRIAWLEESGQPFVSFGRPWGLVDDPSHPWVDVDGAAGTYAATVHCLHHGSGRVAFLGWPQGSGTGDERERGWKEALSAFGGSGPRITSNDALRDAQSTIAEWLDSEDAALTHAMVCASDSLAIGAHLALIAAGRLDMTVVGFDNTPAAEALGISSVEQEPELVAEGALRLLMGADGRAVNPRGRTGPAGILVTPRLIPR